MIKNGKSPSTHQGISNQQKQYQEISSQEKQYIFALSVITLTAKLAKADGVVTQDEIEVFKEKFKIPPNEEEQVRKIFYEAQKTAYGFESIAQQVGELFQDSHEDFRRNFKITCSTLLKLMGRLVIVN